MLSVHRNATMLPFSGIGSKMQRFACTAAAGGCGAAPVTTEEKCDYDLAVIGGGPGGYVAAIRAAKQGMKVACIESQQSLGGTCLNVGCIPSKCLLHSSHVYDSARRGDFRKVGVTVAPQSVRFDLPGVMRHKEKVIKGLSAGIATLFKANRVERICARGTLTNTPGEVRLSTGGSLRARRIVLATGSVPVELPFARFDETRVLSSTGALSLRRVPEHLVVIGAGIIGLELGSVWRRLGANVTFVESLGRIAPGTDMAVARAVKRSLERRGMKFHLSTKVATVEKCGDGKTVRVNAVAPGNKPLTLTGDALLVCVGRRPATKGIGLEAAGVRLEQRGRVAVDEHYRTSARGVYALGDIVAGPMLAHKAEEEGYAVASALAKGVLPKRISWDNIPGVLYTTPEAAWVGISAETARAKGIRVKVGQFAVRGNGRARSIDAADGFAKLIADAKTGRLLGAHIVGPEAGEMIYGCTMAIEHGLTAAQFAHTIFPHPTVSEILKEAALAVDKAAVHV